MNIRVVLVDDHRMLLDVLQTALNGESDIDIVGTAANGREAIALVRELLPDVAVLDIGMPELNGIETTARILERHPDTKVVCLSTYTDKRFVVEMIKAGAVGYVCKSAAATELIHAIRAVMKGQRYLCPKAAAEVVDTALNPANEPNRKPTLSRREREVLQLVAEGLRSTEIAERMHVAESTVEVHRRNIMSKLDLHNIADLTKYAIREGLTSL